MKKKLSKVYLSLATVSFFAIAVFIFFGANEPYTAELSFVETSAYGIGSLVPASCGSTPVTSGSEEHTPGECLGFWADTYSITSGSSVNLWYDVVYGSIYRCWINGVLVYNWPWVGVNGPYGFNTGPLSGTTSYTLTCDNTWGQWLTRSLTITVTPPPATLSNVTISSPSVATDATTEYTITVTGSDTTGGGSAITEEYAMINYQGANAGQYRGYLGWSASASGVFAHWAGFKSGSPLACAGGGRGALHSSTYGSEYLNLVSCSTSVSGNTRTTAFVVTFNTNYTTPTINNTLNGWIRSNSNDAQSSGWGGTNTFTLRGPACSDGLDNDGDGEVDMADTGGCTSVSDTSEVDTASVVFSVCDGDGTDCVASGNTKSVTAGVPLQVRWNSTDADFCSAVSGNGFSTGGLLDGTDQATAPNTVGSHVYRIACGNGGIIEDTKSVTVNTNAGTSTLTVSPRIVNEGSDDATLTWNLAGQTGCTLTGGSLNFDQAYLESNNTFSPTVNAQTTYTLSCTSSGDSVSVTVEIIPRSFET